MEKQKICVIGGGLTGLITASTLAKLNLKVDLITGNINQDIASNRTIAISQNNYDFLKKLGIFKLSKKEFWPCSKMQLYTERKKNFFNKIFELKKDKKQQKIRNYTAVKSSYVFYIGIFRCVYKVGITRGVAYN